MCNEKKSKTVVLKTRTKQLALVLAFTTLAAMTMPASAREVANITFSLKEAELETVVATVAEFTGKNFIIDPRVKGKVTVISAKPMTPDEVYQTFLSLLDVHNFAAVRMGNVIKIIPSVNAKQLGSSGDSSRFNDEIITQVLEVKNVSASQLVPILRPLVPQEGHMAAYAPTNVLIVSDRAANVQRLIKIIERIDVSSATDIEVYTLKHAAAAEVVRIMEALRQREKQADPQAMGAGAPVLVADERTNSILISGDKSERLGIRAVITHLDTPLETGGNTHVAYLRYAKAKELVPVLTGLSESLEKEQQGGAPKAPVPQAGRAPITIQAHEDTNALVITAPPDLLRSLKSVISQLDIRRAQVQVEAIIAEVTDDKSAELGVSWFIDGSPDNKGPIAGTAFKDFNAAAAADSFKNNTIPTLPNPLSFLGFGRFNSGKTDFVGLLNAIQGDSRANVLSRPTIMTLDNEEAEIIVGQTVPFRTGSYTSTGSGATASVTAPFTTIKRENIGITLKVKPQINEGDAVRLDIEQKVESVAPSNAGAADLITNTRSVKTSVLVDDGGTIVLGGLIKDDVTESVQKVPLLGDIPFIGALFRNKSSTKVKTNLMVFLKPTIIRDAAIATRITSGKYDYIRAEQLGFQKKKILLVNKEDIPILPEFIALPPSFEEIKSRANHKQPTTPAVNPPDQALEPTVILQGDGNDAKQ